MAARDREYAVCRLKPTFLKNSIEAREPPLRFACDEQLIPYTGHLSGLKKRMPKKTFEGIEYYTLATSNKDYEGYITELREPPTEGQIKGKILRKADPVSGGYKFCYIMEGGPKYEVGKTSPSKVFGSMILLIFLCGGYLRYKSSILVTDSAYGYLEGMCFLSL